MPPPLPFVASGALGEEAAMREPETRRGWKRIATVLGGVVIAAALLILLASRLATANSTVRSLPASSGLTGHRAPDFSLVSWTDTTGRAPTIHLAALEGHPVVLNFWASWCEPCQGEAPILAAAAHTYMSHGVIFIGIAYDTPQADGVKFLNQYHITYPCGQDTTTATAAAYGVTGIPDTIFIDRHGIVTEKITGPITQASLDAGIQALLR